MRIKYRVSIAAGIAAVSLALAVGVVSQAFADNEGNDNGNGTKMGQMMQSNSASNMMDKMTENMDEGFGGMGLKLESINGNRDAESVVIKPNGDFRVTGAVVNSISSSTSMLNARLFSFSRDINLAGAQIYGANHPISLGDIQPGDKLMATGNFNESTHAITVSQINDTSYTTRNTSDIQTRIQALMQIVNQLQAQLKALLNQ